MEGSRRGVRPLPRERLAPWSRDHQAAPPQPPESSTRGPEGHSGEPPPPLPLPPLPPQPTDSRRPARGTAAPHPPLPGPGGDPLPERAATPRGGPTAAVRAAVRRVPQVSRPPPPAVPAEGRQPCAGTHGHPAGRTWTAARGREPVQCGGQGNDKEARLGASPRGGGETD